MVDEPAGQEINDAGDDLVYGRIVGPAVAIENGLFVGKSLNEQIRDAAITDFPVRVVGLFGKDRGVESMSAHRSANPSSAARGSSGPLRDLQVVAYVQV